MHSSCRTLQPQDGGEFSSPKVIAKIFETLEKIGDFHLDFVVLHSKRCLNAIECNSTDKSSYQNTYADCKKQVAKLDILIDSVFGLINSIGNAGVSAITITKKQDSKGLYNLGETDLRYP